MEVSINSPFSSSFFLPTCSPEGLYFSDHLLPSPATAIVPESFP